MTLDSLLDLARKVRRGGVIGELVTDGQGLARAILDLLGEAQPCGWEEPAAVQVHPEYVFPTVTLPAQWSEAKVSPDEARALARMLLHAADAAQLARAGNGGGE
jgi:hypothetical protein